MSGRRVMVVSLVFLLVGTVPAVNAQNPLYGVDDRVFPEPMMATSFLQWDDFVVGLETLHATYPDYLDVFVIGESLEGRPIYFVEITDELSETAREDKLQIGYSASIHANEAAGREGTVRAIEDLASGRGELGDMQSYLDRILINIWFPNPDSWASGDWFTVDPARIFEGPPSFYRTNAANVDLNREFPNPGLIFDDHTPMSEPESQSVVSELRYSGRHSNLVAGTDLHGMINSPNMMRAIIPNQDMDFHRMMHAIRFLSDLENRVNTNPHFAEWNQLADALCLLPDVPVDPVADAEEGAHPHGHDIELTDQQLLALAIVDDGDGVWTQHEAEEARALGTCGEVTGGPTGGVGHGKPFLWGARWDQIGYTDSGFTSDYLMLSPRSPTGGMGAVGTITEFAYSHMVPNNNYVAKLNDMHVAGVRETMRAQIEYTLLEEAPRLLDIGSAAYVPNPERVQSTNDTNRYEASHGKAFDVNDQETWFEFDQVEYDVANTDFWRDLGKYVGKPNAETEDADSLTELAPNEVTAESLAGQRSLILTDAVVDTVDAQTILTWVESGGNLVLTDAALGFFDAAGLTTDAAFEETYYLGHSDLTPGEHPLLAGVNWNARQSAEAIPIGYGMNEYPQWHLHSDRVNGLDLHVAGTTGGHPSLGTVTVGEGTIHFIGAALAQPVQHNDHRYGLAPYAVTALTYYVFVNALGGTVDWVPQDGPFVPFYPDDPLYGHVADDEPDATVTEPTPGIGLAIVLLALLGTMLLAMRRRR